MSNFETVDEYRVALAAVTDASDLAGFCIGAVFTGGTVESDEAVGTIVAIRHRQGWGLFGTTVYTFVKLCPECVHRSSNSCPSNDDLEWQQVSFVEAVTRNGDGPVPSPERGE